MIKMIRAMAVTAAVALGAPAAGQAANYKGRTAGGNTVSFRLSGKKVSRLSTAVPTLCLETTGSGASRAGIELFQPPVAFTVGRTSKQKALQPAAMNMGIKATKNYTITTKRSGKTIEGKLRVTLSFLRPDLYRYLPYTYLCTGSTTFSARAR